MQFELDTDENSATGSHRTGITDIGIEYIMNVGSTYYGAFGFLQKYDGVRLFPNVSSAEATFATDGIDITLPGDGIKGPLAYRVLVSSQLGPVSFSSVQDAMPDDRTPPAVVR